MKANWKKTSIAAALVLGVLGAAASAQPYLQPVHGGGGGYGMGPGMMGGYGMGPGMMGGYGMGPGMMGGLGRGPGMMGGYGSAGYGLGLLERLDLSATQREQLRKIEDDLRRKNWDVMGRMQDEMAKARDAWTVGKTDRSAILAANKRMFELRQQMLENRLDAQDKAEALLTPQQKEQVNKLAQAPDDDD